MISVLVIKKQMKRVAGILDDTAFVVVVVVNFEQWKNRFSTL